MINTLIIFVTIAGLFMGKIHSVPFETSDMAEAITEETTIEITTVTTTTTTTTTTLPPELDREWEDLVLAGPAVVNYLSLFMIFVSHKDEALTPTSGYIVEYIDDVHSLHRILLQISSSMQTAFRLARDDLVRVRSSMNQIPEHLKAGLLLIKTAPDSLLRELLPYTLRNVDRAAKEGSTVSKPTLDRFISVGLLLKELNTLMDLALSTVGHTDYLIEANIYANDLKTQWDLLIKLFRKFSERADITQQSIDENFIAPIEEAQKTNDFNSQSKRSNHLNELIPAAIVIDQFSYLLEMMVNTYTDISSDYMANDITSINHYLGLDMESKRVIEERNLWHNIVSQSAKIARLAQERQNQFVDTGSSRQVEYGTYLQSAIAA